MIDLKATPIIIFGDDFWNTYGLIRSFGEAGLRPYFINVCDGFSYVKHSRYIKKYWQVMTVSEGISILETEFANSEQKPVLICSNDRAMSAFDAIYNRLSHAFHLSHAGNKPGEINRLMNKEVMFEYAHAAGLTLPQSITVDLDADDGFYAEVSYPCITKPLLSVEGDKEDIIVCRSEAELRHAVDIIKQNGCLRVQIQKFIEKEAEMMLIGASLPTGEVVLPGILRKIHEYPMGFTALASIAPDIETYIDPAKVRDFVHRLGFVGLFSIEFLLSQGDMYFMEINFRNDGNGYAPTAAGINLPLILAQSYTGKTIDGAERLRVNGSLTFQVDDNSLNYWVNGIHHGNWAGFIAEAKRVDFHLLANKKDIAPAFYRFVARKLKSIFKI